MKKDNHLFISYNLFHIFYIRLIITEFNIKNYTLYNYHAREVEKNGECNVMTYTDNLFLRFNINNYAYVYIPHNLGVISNYIYQHYNNRIYYFYEGVMYIRNSIYNVPNKEMVRRVFLSSLLGFRYRIVPMFCSSDKRVNGIIAPDKIKIKANNKIVLNLEKVINDYGKEKIILILGQVTSKDRINSTISDIKKIKSKFPEWKCIYKPHPYELKKGLHKKIKYSISVYEKDEIAEVTINKIKPAKVISYTSSTLINIAIISSDIDVYSIVKKNQLTDLQKIMGEYGVQYLSL